VDGTTKNLHMASFRNVSRRALNLVHPLADRSSLMTGRASKGLVSVGRTVSYPTNNNDTNLDRHVTDCYRSDVCLTVFPEKRPLAVLQGGLSTIQQAVTRRSDGRKSNQICCRILRERRDRMISNQ
jgi:hypothetical protein